MNKSGSSTLTSSRHVSLSTVDAGGNAGSSGSVTLSTGRGLDDASGSIEMTTGRKTRSNCPKSWSCSYSRTWEQY